MTKLTTELLEKYIKTLENDDLCLITESELESVLRQLLAYEQAAKNPIGSFHISGGQVEATTDYCRDGEWPVQDGEVLVYAAPVLPKQPESESIICWSCKKTITLTQHAEADGFCPLCDAEIELEPTQPVMPEHCQMTPDEMLCDFYEVSNWPDLVRELVKHVEQLQESAKRNVKPWEDTFPETLLPAYVDRITRDNDACRAEILKAQLVSEPYKLPELNDELIEILGRPNFTCTKLAECLRKCGQEIKRKSEYEQAAEHPAARITWDGSEFSVSNVSEDFLYGGTAVYLAPVLPKQPELIGMKVSIDTGSDNIGHRLFGEIVGTSESNGVPVLCIEVTENNVDVAAPAQPVRLTYKLKDAVADIRNSGVEIDTDKIKAERDALNSPVIPEGSVETNCIWSTDSDGVWLGDCGLTWTFFDDGPNENGLKYCPSCGKKISVITAPAQEQK